MQLVLFQVSRPNKAIILLPMMLGKALLLLLFLVDLLTRKLYFKNIMKVKDIKKILIAFFIP